MFEYATIMDGEFAPLDGAFEAELLIRKMGGKVHANLIEYSGNDENVLQSIEFLVREKGYFNGKSNE